MKPNASGAVVCRVCDRPTGREDDALYCDVCGIGPLCEACTDTRYDGVRCTADHGEEADRG